MSFGLVLLATILLIVGLFNDTLGLIYLSIVASVLAAIVLFLAFRMARPKGDKAKEAPEPLDTGDAPEPTTVSPAVPATAGAPAAAEPAASPARAAPSAAPAATAAASTASDDDWMDDDEWDDGVVDFPIADYDDLTVAEVMPLLPQLYSDELDTVVDRERSGRNRSTILKRLEELKVSGTAADLEDPDAGVGVAPEPERAPEPEPAEEWTPPSPVSARAGGVGREAGDLEEDDDFFPIADYDDLTVGQIVPLLDQLEPDELQDVRARETSIGGRKTVLAEIDRLLSGAPAPAAAPAPARSSSGRSRFPIADYDDLTVADIRPRLGDLSDSQLETVLDHERATGGRTSIINEIDRRLGSAPARKTSSRKSAARKTSTRKSAARKSTARKATKRSSRTPRFPIANYDDLNVADIRPRLGNLSERQLELVRDREASGAGRKTILNDIDSRLS